MLLIYNTVKQDISVDTSFSQLGDFAVSLILVFADAGTEHSSFIVISIETLSFIFADWMSTAKICPLKYPVLQYSLKYHIFRIFGSWVIEKSVNLLQKHSLFLIESVHLLKYLLHFDFNPLESNFRVGRPVPLGHIFLFFHT